MGPLGPLTTPKPDYIPVRSAIQKSIDDEPSNIAAFAKLATQCATTFRSTDYVGGCNGTSLRHGLLVRVVIVIKTRPTLTFRSSFRSLFHVSFIRYNIPSCILCFSFQ
jgi:hypothetical protein